MKIKLENGQEVEVPEEIKTVGQMIDWTRSNFNCLPADEFYKTVAKTLDNLEKLKEQEEKQFKMDKKQKQKLIKQLFKSTTLLKFLNEVTKRKNPKCEKCKETIIKWFKTKPTIEDFEIYWEEGGFIGLKGICRCEIVLYFKNFERTYVFRLREDKVQIKQEKE